MAREKDRKPVVDDFRDDEVQMLGTVDPFRKLERKRFLRQVSWASLAIVALLGLGVVLFWPKNLPEEVEGVFESSIETSAINLLGRDSTVVPYAEKLDTVVNGHPLTLFIPHHATPRLRVGQTDAQTLQTVMGFQAADIRADNYEILGEFVLAGDQLAEGVSKKGFCAIVDGRITVGVGEKTPLLNEAIAKGGYFFRQYPLVDDGIPVENKPKGKTVRKALCSRGGQVFVVFSGLDETFPDFAHVLADLGVDNAIYLVGSDATFGWTVDADGHREQYGNWDRRPEYRNESYILWD